MTITKQFFDLVLPVQGHRMLATPTKSGGYAHHPYENNAIAATAAQQFDARGDTVFYALAGFKAPRVWNDVKGTWNYRTKDNAGWLRSLWLDLDCGEGKGYPTQRAAVEDVVRFVKEAKIPAPSAVVNSGNGVHVYWAFDADIDASRWEKIAAYWKAVVTHYRVKHDPVRTSDRASVLRPVGVHHRKAEPKPVQIIGTLRPAIPVLVLVKRLNDLVREHSLTIRAPSVKVDTTTVEVNSDLTGGMDHPPSFGAIIASKCNQVRQFEMSGGDVPEPVWYNVLGLLKHCVDGVELAHQWSSGDPRYSAQDTDAKMAQWVFGPTTCTQFQQVNPEACDGCKRKVMTPIFLGQPDPENTEIAVPAELAEEVESAKIGIPPELAHKYRWDTHNILAAVPGEEETTWLPFSSSLLIPIDYYRDPDLGYCLTVIVNVGGNSVEKWDTFTLPVKHIGTGGADLFRTLGENNITVSVKKFMESYLIDWQNHIKKQLEETSVFHQFGWQEDNSLLIGTRNYLPSGEVKTVRVHNNASILADKLTMEGDVETWKVLIDRAYNYDGQEQYQFMLGTGFGSLLLPLMKGKFPSIISAVSYESGLGKSSVERSALGIWGNPTALEMAKGQTTMNALYARMGTMNHLPFMYDEVTNIGAQDASQLAYTVSQGISKDRLDKNGTLRESQYTWNNLFLTSGNRSLISTIGAGKAAAEGEIARIFEFKYKDVSRLPKHVADQIFGDLTDNYGVAGDVFARYLVQNREKVRRRLVEVQQHFDKIAGISKRERFWSAAVAATMTGLIVAKELELVAFDLKALTKWVVAQIKDMQSMLQENSVDKVDIFGQMLNSLANGFIITDILGDLRAGRPAEVLQRPSGEITGRVVLSTGVAYVQQAAIRRWCDKAQVDFKYLRDQAVSNGYISPDSVQISLGKGTGIPGGPANCFSINWEMAVENTAFAAGAFQRDTLRVVK